MSFSVGKIYLLIFIIGPTQGPTIVFCRDVITLCLAQKVQYESDLVASTI